MIDLKRKTGSEHFQLLLESAPKILSDFVKHMVAIKGKSEATAIEYFRDVVWLFRHIIYVKGIEFENHIDIMSENSHKDYIDLLNAISPIVDTAFVNAITKDDIVNYLMFMAKNKVSARSRNRRLSSIKEFFNFCEREAKIIDFNPAVNIGYAKIEKKLPKYLTLEESNRLLDNIPEGKNYERNYCIITLFLNCGLRLSELENINIKDIKDDTLRIMGKGSKERILHLNEACMKAVETYMQVRFSNVYNVKDKNALFITSTTGQRLKKRRIALIVDEALKSAGLDGKGYTTHKLRHTAATLMYQYGNVDVLTLKDILGHENLDTTQIYTHTNSKQMQEAINKNPLAKKNVD